MRPREPCHETESLWMSRCPRGGARSGSGAGRVAQVGGGEPVVEGGGDRAQVGLAAALVGVGEPAGAGQGHRAGEDADGDERDQRDQRAQPRVWHEHSLSARQRARLNARGRIGSPAPCRPAC